MTKISSLHRRVRICLVAIILIIASALTSCVQHSGEGDITFTDALGYEVSLDGAPARVAALLGSFADVWCLAGGSLVAAPEDAWEDFGLSLNGAVNIGGAHSPSLELLLSASPDFVIASSSTASHLEMRDTLLSMGIEVAYFDVDCFNDYLAMLECLTRITGREDLYIRNGLALRDEIEAIKSLYSDTPLAERRVLLLRASSTTVKAKGSDGTVLGEMLYDMGCVNIADSDKSLLENLSVESVIFEEPYHIFVVTMGSDTDAAIDSLNSLIMDNPAWSGLSAIAEGRLHIMDKALFNLKPNARWGLAYETLFDKLTAK